MYIHKTHPKACSRVHQHPRSALIRPAHAPVHIHRAAETKVLRHRRLLQLALILLRVGQPLVSAHADAAHGQHDHLQQQPQHAQQNHERPVDAHIVRVDDVRTADAGQLYHVRCAGRTLAIDQTLTVAGRRRFGHANAQLQPQRHRRQCRLGRQHSLRMAAVLLPAHIGRLDLAGHLAEHPLRDHLIRVDAYLVVLGDVLPVDIVIDRRTGAAVHASRPRALLCTGNHRNRFAVPDVHARTPSAALRRVALLRLALTTTEPDDHLKVHVATAGELERMEAGEQEARAALRAAQHRRKHGRIGGAAVRVQQQDGTVTGVRAGNQIGGANVVRTVGRLECDLQLQILSERDVGEGARRRRGAANVDDAHGDARRRAGGVEQRRTVAGGRGGREAGIEAERGGERDVVDVAVGVHVVVDDAADLDEAVALRLDERVHLDDDQRGEERAIGVGGAVDLVCPQDAAVAFALLVADGDAQNGGAEWPGEER